MSLKSKLEKMPFYNDLVLPVHYGQALRAGMKYGWPAKKLRVIGVTGTNGKTTTCFMIWKMLNESGRKCGLLTTVGWSEDGAELHRQYEHMTTERVEVLNERMKVVAEAGAEFLVLEVTSHALAQYRILGVPIEIAVFTNLTHEHLDYHRTFENYRKAKGKLFERAGCGIVNIDDKNGEWFAKVNAAGDIITYGIEQGEVRATDIKLKTDGVEYACGDMRIKTRIPGKFNVYNSLAAVCVGEKLGLSNKEIEDGIYALREVEGRMNRIDEGQKFDVIVDYAHTPDALENVFSSVDSSSERSTSLSSPVRGSSTLSTAPLRASNSPRISSPITSSGVKERRDFADEMATDDSGPEGRGKSKVIVVHGGAGRRDESTRPVRGEILGKYSDIVIITEDDSRDEDPEKIAAQFVEGAEKAGKVLNKDLFVELDRRKAIEKALGMARKGDLVLILGKGHEKTILRADGPHEFEDIKVAKEILKEMEK